MSRARLILRALTVLVAIPFFYLVFGLVGGLVPGPVAQITPQPGEVRIGLARGPIHYDFLLPVTPDLRRRFAFAAKAGVPLDHSGARWLMVGWGASEFYTQTSDYGDMALGPIAHAITGDSAVLRLNAVGPVDGIQGVRFLILDPAQYEALLTGIEQSFAPDTEGRPVALTGIGFGLTDAFFHAKGQFNIFHTCNAWIGRHLRAAGVPFGIWTPTPQSVDLSLWRLGGRAQSGG